MPRMTQKYKAALKAREQHGLVCDTIPQDVLYAALEQHWIFWDSTTGQWEKGQEPDDPTPLLMVRVWSNLDEVNDYADIIKTALESRGYACVQASKPYVNRPPKQLEGRVYLQFLPGGNVA